MWKVLVQEVQKVQDGASCKKLLASVTRITRYLVHKRRATQHANGPTSRIVSQLNSAPEILISNLQHALTLAIICST